MIAGQTGQIEIKNVPSTSVTWNTEPLGSIIQRTFNESNKVKHTPQWIADGQFMAFATSSADPFDLYRSIADQVGGPPPFIIIKRDYAHSG